MKRNKMMRTASGLLVATLLTTSVISGTFAKYVTSAEGSDDARVAKFGVVIDAKGTMFADEYNTNDSNVSGTIAKSVVTSGKTGDAVVAPGTSGDLVESTITGKPEIAVNVKREATLILDGWTAKQSADAESATYYCPIKITVDDTEYYGLNYSSADEFKKAVEDAIKADNHNYAANTDLSGVSKDTLNVTWEWAFEGQNGTQVNRTDYADTYLGDQAANTNSKAATIKLEVTTTVTQID